MPAVCAGIVAVLAPLALLAITNPAVLKVVLQLLPTLHAVPSVQHWRWLVAASHSPDSRTLAAEPSVAAG